MSKSNSEKLLERYEQNRVIRGLVQLIPLGVGGAADVVLVKTLDNIRHDRSRTFFDELSQTSRPLDPAVLESEDFLHCYFSTVRYALNTRHREKIEMFARLLKSSLDENGPKEMDEYEEFLKVLDDLTFREIKALAILDEFSDTPRNSDENDLQWAKRFWDDFEERIIREIGIDRDLFADFMNRISRTGCYELFVGGYWDYTGGQGKLTATYTRLKKFIKEKSEPS